MNYYERIQRSIDYIESHLTEELTPESCAREAFMSLSGYYRIFLSVVGYNVKEYIRLRRLTLALDDLRAGQTVLSVAVKYGYRSVDSFARAFRSRHGLLPSRAKGSHMQWIRFERMDLMEKFIDQNAELQQKYPDIKVIRELEPMKAACFTYFGDAPEDHAFAEMKRWIHENGLTFHQEGYRVFGYNNPDPSDPMSDETYGYEVCITVPDALYDSLPDVPEGFTRGTYDGVKRRTLPGGRYAVLSVKRDEQGEIGSEIARAWQRFSAWLHESRYVWGGSQYLEEHLGFTEEDDHIGGVDLYISIQEAPREALVPRLSREEIPAAKAAVFRTEGPDGEKNAQESWRRMLAFAKAHELPAEGCRIFQYNKGFDRKPPFFHTVILTLPEGCPAEGPEIGTFPGGSYMTAFFPADRLMEGWMLMEKWRKESQTVAGNHQWVEEWTLTGWQEPQEQVKLCYPIQ